MTLASTSTIDAESGTAPLSETKQNDEVFAASTARLQAALQRIDQPFWIRRRSDGEFELFIGGGIPNSAADSVFVDPWRFCPAVLPENLGDASFRTDLGLKYAYMAGAMANGIGSEEIVESLGRAGMVGFFGAAGLPPSRVERAIDRIQSRLPGCAYGFNLIHSPNEPELESSIASLYIRRNIRLVEASAFLDVTLPIVRYRVAGIHRGVDGKIETPNHVIAKISRVEVATKFLSPPPEKHLSKLLQSGEITAEQAELARRIPMAQDLTAEADSGGHTDNRPAVTLLPTMLALRDRLAKQFEYGVPLRIGAAGGIATPAAVAAAFTMGAAYVATGSINQACVESGSSDIVREMLAEAQQADVMMAPAADMFEMGVKVQVLKRGTLFAMRAAKLYDLYRSYGGIEDLPPEERMRIERDLFRAPLEEIWAQTKEFFQQRDPRQVERANRDGKHRMALIFRWYLGHASRWANAGEPTRKVDYQVWCGPAMGAFNEWAAGSFLADWRNRRVATLAMNLLYGAAVLTRVHVLRIQGTRVDDGPLARPLPLDEVLSRCRCVGKVDD